jgi:hypothetical protein
VLQLCCGRSKCRSAFETARDGSYAAPASNGATERANLRRHIEERSERQRAGEMRDAKPTLCLLEVP